jgi:hypothetical protein
MGESGERKVTCLLDSPTASCVPSVRVSTLAHSIQVAMALIFGLKLVGVLQVGPYNFFDKNRATRRTGVASIVLVGDFRHFIVHTWITHQPYNTRMSMGMENMARNLEIISPRAFDHKDQLQTERGGYV